MNNEKDPLKQQPTDGGNSEEKAADQHTHNEELVSLPVNPPTATGDAEKQQLINMTNPLESRTAKPLEKKTDETLPGKKDSREEDGFINIPQQTEE